MTRKKFLDILFTSLKKLPENEKIDIIRYYQEIFDGKGYINEEDILPEEYDNPKKIAYEILYDIKSKDFNDSSVKNTSSRNYIGLIILGLLSAPVTLPLIITFAILIIIPVIILITLLVSFLGTSIISILFIAEGINYGIATVVFLIGLSITGVGIVILTIKLIELYFKLLLNIIDKMRNR